MDTLLIFKRISEWLTGARVLGITLVALVIIIPFALVNIIWLFLLLAVLQIILFMKFAPRNYLNALLFTIINFTAFVVIEYLKGHLQSVHTFEANIFTFLGIVEVIVFLLSFLLAHNYPVASGEPRIPIGTKIYYLASMIFGVCGFLLYIILRFRVGYLSVYGLISDAISYPVTFGVFLILIPFGLIASSVVGFLDRLRKKQGLIITSTLIIISCFLAILFTVNELTLLKPNIYCPIIARGAGGDINEIPEEIKNWYPRANSKLKASGEFKDGKLEIEYVYSGYTTNGFIRSIRISAGGEIINKSLENGEGQPLKGIWSLGNPNLFVLSDPIKPQEPFAVKYGETIKPNKNSKHDKSPIVTSQVYIIDSNIFLTQYLPGFEKFDKTAPFFIKYYPENEIAIRISFPPNVFITSEPKPVESFTDKTGVETLTYEENEMEYLLFYTKPFARSQLFKVLIPGYSLKNLAIVCLVGLSLMIVELSLDISIPRFIKKLRRKKRQKSNTYKLFK